MTRIELANAVYERHGGISRREAREIVQVILDIMRDRLAAGERVEIPGFGSFEVRWAPPRTGRHPVTGRRFQVSGRRSLVFRPSRLLKRDLNATAS